jgi:hypothetical protein
MAIAVFDLLIAFPNLRPFIPAIWHVGATLHHLCAIDLSSTYSILRTIAGAGLPIHEQGGEETARSWRSEQKEDFSFRHAICVRRYRLFADTRKTRFLVRPSPRTEVHEFAAADWERRAGQKEDPTLPFGRPAGHKLIFTRRSLSLHASTRKRIQALG